MHEDGGHRWSCAHLPFVGAMVAAAWPRLQHAGERLQQFMEAAKNFVETVSAIKLTMQKMSEKQGLVEKHLEGVAKTHMEHMKGLERACTGMQETLLKIVKYE